MVWYRIVSDVRQNLCTKKPTKIYTNPSRKLKPSFITYLGDITNLSEMVDLIKIKFSTFVLLLLCVVLSLFFCHGQTFVDSDASGNNDGTSWEDAFINLQDVLDNVIQGGQIWIADGT